MTQEEIRQEAEKLALKYAEDKVFAEVFDTNIHTAFGVLSALTAIPPPVLKQFFVLLKEDRK